ncbi:Transposable element P transposase [Amphibalanus amphitrite]|uniref:Transposable element P transposase n=1 Tax=Amphibalanus amphitrite TaxID=1232801 RepID=A0A6A4W139_AMPAM|nr:Transposable element P transposase [Amphibalanus amphitrite]
MHQPEGDKLISIRTEEIDAMTGLPLITSNITVYSDLRYKMHSNGVQLSIKETSDITKSDTFVSFGEVLNVLARVKSLTVGSKARLEVAAKILDPLTDSITDEEIRLVATFVTEQLRLACKLPRSRSYSPFLLGAAVVWDRISPKLYETLYMSNIFCLPHSRTLRRLTSALQVNAGLDSSTMAYLGLRIEKLEPRECLVNLAMDEVYTAQCMELAGGRMYGQTAGKITKTLFCTHINSVAGCMYNMERGNPGKMAYKLTDKVLRPSVLERVNVGLAAAATDETTTAALRHFEEHVPDCQGFADTAEFLELIRRWFNTCNVKSEHMARRLNDKSRVALRSGCEDSDKSLDFLSKFGNYMRSFHDIVGSKQMSKDTCMAVFYCSRGLAGLAKYLLETYSDLLNYVLLGKIQSDHIERHFGHLRKISGGNYWSSVRQFMENEAVIRIKSLIWWSGFPPAEIAKKMAPSQQEHQFEDMKVVDDLVEAARQAEHEELDDSTKAALGHIAGYLAHSATKSSKCTACADLMVDREVTLVNVTFETDKTNGAEGIYRSFTQLLDRGKLLAPSRLAITSTLDICQIWRCLVKSESTRRQLLTTHLPRKVFVDVVTKLESNDVELDATNCNQGHSTIGLKKRMAGALFNLFAGNMVRDVNSDIHAKRKSGEATVHCTRTQCDDKRRKLTGVKRS